MYIDPKIPKINGKGTYWKKSNFQLQIRENIYQIIWQDALKIPCTIPQHQKH